MNNFEKLTIFANKHNITLLKDYQNDKIVYNTKIHLKCPGCNHETYKCFRYMLIKEVALCKICITIKSLPKQRETMMNKYGVSHCSQDKNTREKIKSTFIKKYGVINPSMTDAVKEKQKQTNMQKYGVPYVILNSSVKEKLAKTNQQKYGSNTCLENKDIREKAKQTCLIKYGKTNPGQCPEFQNKMKATMMEKYGVEYPLQNADIMNKMVENHKQSNGFYKMKKYVMPSGNEIMYQGYEHFALNELLQNKISESDIIISRNQVPEIYYYDKSNKKRRYYVDIYVPSLNKCIEVKSEYTMKINIDTVYRKMASSIASGYSYEIWIYNNKGNKINCITELPQDYNVIKHLPDGTSSSSSFSSLAPGL